MKQLITELLKEAMKKQNVVKKEVYRSLLADIAKAEKSGNPFDELAVITKSRNNRLEAAEQYKLANREDLSTLELNEVEIINELLPNDPTDEELFFAIHDAKILYGNTMGMIIKEVKMKYPTVNGKKLAEMVKSYISK